MNLGPSSTPKGAKLWWPSAACLRHKIFLRRWNLQSTLTSVPRSQGPHPSNASCRSTQANYYSWNQVSTSMLFGECSCTCQNVCPELPSSRCLEHHTQEPVLTWIFPTCLNQGAQCWAVSLAGSTPGLLYTCHATWLLCKLAQLQTQALLIQRSSKRLHVWQGFQLIMWLSRYEERCKTRCSILCSSVLKWFVSLCQENIHCSAQRQDVCTCIYLGRNFIAGTKPSLPLPFRQMRHTKSPEDSDYVCSSQVY